MFREFFNQFRKVKPQQPDFVRTFSSEPRKLVAVGSDKKEGAFARVYDSEMPGMVVKRGSTIRDGYIAWLAYVVEHGPNPLFPQIYAIHYDRRLGEFWVLMEKLTPQVCPLDKHGRPDWDNDKRLSGNSISSYVGKLSDDDLETLGDALEFISRNYGYPDLHAANWMMRGDQPVITDPISTQCGRDDDDGNVEGEEQYLQLLESALKAKGLNILTYGD